MTNESTSFCMVSMATPTKVSKTIEEKKYNPNISIQSNRTAESHPSHSNEGYVVDFVQRQISHGNIVAVIVTRGLGDSTIIGSNILNFARISYVGAAAKALKKAINGVRSDEHMPLVGVSYSMGELAM